MTPRFPPPRRPRIRENVNEAIRAREVRAVFPDGSVEVMPTPAAIRRAQELGLDLILIAPTAEPPVAKAMDYGQWQYENKKKQHEAKKKQHVIQVKELKFRPNTDDHDYDFKKNHAIRFLQEGNRVKAVVQFRGREIAHTDLGRKLLTRFDAATASSINWSMIASTGATSCRTSLWISRSMRAKSSSAAASTMARPWRMRIRLCGAIRSAARSPKASAAAATSACRPSTPTRSPVSGARAGR